MKNIKSYYDIIKNNLKSDVFKIIFKRPRYFFLLLRVRILNKPFGDLYFLSPRCLIIKIFEDLNFKKIKDFDLKKFGNYFLDTSKIDKKKIILYSGGVGKNISFDKAVTKKYNCKARLFDPTPDSIKFMKNKSTNKIFFYPYAIYKKNKKIKIFYDKYNLVKSNSISNYLDFGKEDFYYCNAHNIPYLKNKFKDNNIDILKLDIEGVAMEVIDNCFKNKIFPTQIILALEVPLDYLKFINFYKKLKIFINRLGVKYELINIRNRMRGVEMEILCLKKDKLLIN